jgi:hypothetical protein
VAEAVRSAEIERVVDPAVDAFDVVAAPEQRLEVGIAWGNDAQVLGPVEGTVAIFIGCVESVGSQSPCCPAVRTGCTSGNDPAC